MRIASSGRALIFKYVGFVLREEQKWNHKNSNKTKESRKLKELTNECKEQKVTWGGLFASLSMAVFKASGMGEITQCTKNLYQLKDLSSDFRNACRARCCRQHSMVRCEVETGLVSQVCQLITSLVCAHVYW